MRLRAGRRREKREDEGEATSPQRFGSNASLSSSSESPSLPRSFADISLVSSLEPALKAARRSSDNLLELVKNEREKVTQSIRSAALAAAASPFAPVSLDDFGGEAWRNATSSLAFFGGKAGAAEQATETRKMKGNSSNSNNATASSKSTTATSSPRLAKNRRAVAPSSASHPPQFGLDVFSALNESLMRGSSSSGGGSTQLKSQVR